MRLWHLTSLDAPTVAVVWTLAFSWAARVRLPYWVPLLLALTAWAVYIADRLLDARASLPTAPHRLRERHFFHWRHREIFVPLGAAAACAAAWIILARMPSAMRQRDSVLGVAAMAYFTGVHAGRGRSRLLAALLKKELLVGVLFTAACALPAWYQRWLAGRGAPAWPFLALVLLFALLAWLNCHLISRWETGKNGLPGRHAVHPAATLVLATALLATVLCAAHPRAAAVAAAAALSALLLVGLDRLRARLTPVALRASADLVLLTPLLLILAAR
jgi:hypothetical protein